MKNTGIYLKKMKGAVLLVPAILLVLVNCFFVLKESKPSATGAAADRDRLSKKTMRDVPAATSTGTIVLRSADGGKTWQDVSEGLPEYLRKAGLREGDFVANDRGFYVSAGDGVYHSEPGSATSFWKKEIFPGKRRNITSANDGMFAYNFRGQFLRKANGKTDWSRMFNDFQVQAVRLNKTDDWMYKNYQERQVSSIFETKRGTVFIGSNNAVFKSADGGKTWKVARVEGWVQKMAESDGVLLAVSSRGILRSTDDGDSWDRVTGEGSVGVAVEPIDGGFAAIASNAVTHINTVYLSLDNAKTWSAIGSGFLASWSISYLEQGRASQPSLHISAIKRLGGDLICSRPDGVFRSSDLGKTWKRLLPSADNMGFTLAVSGGVIYAMPNKGC